MNLNLSSKLKTFSLLRKYTKNYYIISFRYILGYEESNVILKNGLKIWIGDEKILHSIFELLENG
jgi:hypothetical protein